MYNAHRFKNSHDDFEILFQNLSCAFHVYYQWQMLIFYGSNVYFIICKAVHK